VAQLTPELAEQVVAACTQNAEEAAGALGRSLDGEFVVRAGESKPYSPAPAGPGLVFAFRFGDEGMLALLPAASGLVPDWVRKPDPTGASKLSTLGQELSMLLVPDSLMADSFEGRWVEDLAAAVERAQPADATTAAVELASGEKLGELSLIWPVADADAALAEPTAADAPELAATEPPAAEEPKPSVSKVLRWQPPQPRDLRDLPPNVVSALRVTVSLSVNLAGKKSALRDIVELGPGSIITFDKPCDAPLEVTVGGHPVALGEAVKVGDRFGIRVLQMILPEERFRPMLPATREPVSP
jgi:flagellar motor switch/type III secretory pathway protein FliN